MLFTQYGKALQSGSPDPVLRDPWAEEAVRHIAYDFGKLKARKYESRIIAVRARQFDVLTRDFIAEQSSSIVLQLGCGMDSRVYRVDPPETVRWFDIDYPDVIQLRRRLYPERPGYHVSKPAGTAGRDSVNVTSAPGRPSPRARAGLLKGPHRAPPRL